jgi:hypothetical protein
LYINNSFVAVVGLVMTIPGAAYNIWLYARVFYGPLNGFVIHLCRC